jgi:hypothetical protein
MDETSRRTFFKGATALALGATVVPSAVDGQTSATATDTATDYESFLRLSYTLTGMSESELPAMAEQQDVTGARVRLYELCSERLRSAYPAEFGELLAVWRRIQDLPNAEAALSERLGAPGAAAQRLRLAARQVIKIWYLSTIDDPKRPLDPQKKGKSDGQLGGDLGQYQHSAIWKLIGAPVPGYSNAPHGYWSHKPRLS